jgi:hypothetical protein
MRISETPGASCDDVTSTRCGGHSWGEGMTRAFRCSLLLLILVPVTTGSAALANWLVVGLLVDALYATVLRAHVRDRL